MDIRSEKQVNPVADEVSAITAIVSPILQGVLYALKAEAVSDAGGHETLLLRTLARLRRPGDGDCGISFEYAVHDALNRRDPAVLERVSTALTLCRITPTEVSSILFGVEKSGSQSLIDTASSALTGESSLLYGRRGRPVKLQKHLQGISAAFRKPTERLALPQSISGLWKADLFVGAQDSEKWVGTTVKINRTALDGARGLRVGIVPARQSSSDAIQMDEDRNLVVCPLPYDGSFMEMFYLAWETVQQFLAADARLPSEVNLPRPAQRAVARYLADRRDFAVLEVIAALSPLSQPELLETHEDEADLAKVGKTTGLIATSSMLAPEPLMV